MLMTAGTTSQEILRQQKGVGKRQRLAEAPAEYIPKVSSNIFESVLEGKGCREECEERVHRSLKDPGR